MRAERRAHNRLGFAVQLRSVRLQADMKLVGIDFQLPTSCFVVRPVEVTSVRRFLCELTERGR
ncbi:hypothetical protein [Streptomyces sp. NPDC001292]|uniref:hypothetical protein n=1 Tax=Streptomyces sp. NPDC001292 TaxID=3364558 RepID=UPI00369B48F9